MLRFTYTSHKKFCQKFRKLVERCHDRSPRGNGENKSKMCIIITFQNKKSLSIMLYCVIEV